MTPPVGANANDVSESHPDSRVGRVLAGCGRKEYEVVPVSGTVTLDGSPLADVVLSFAPLAKDKDNPNVGPGSLGRTDAEGRYTRKTIRGENGAVPAEHVVRMMMAGTSGNSE